MLFRVVGIGTAAIEISAQATRRSRSIGVIEPKLALPRLQPRMFRRPRRLEIVDGDAGAALTVVNAPVGYRKTTLLRSWTHLATAVERFGPGPGGPAPMSLDARGAGSKRPWTS